MGVPDLSVIIVVIESIEKLIRCVNALVQQTGNVTSEIIIPFDDRTPDLALLSMRFSEIRFLYAHGRRTYAELRTLAVQHSCAAVIALTEDHFMPRADWMIQILQAHTQQPFAAIGGAVDKHQPDTLVNWSLYFADYARYMNPIREGFVLHLTDGNVTYKRAALEKVADCWRTEFHEDEVHRALRANGDSLWLSGQIVVQQQRSLTLSAAMRDRYIFGRLFGGRRAMSTTLFARILFIMSTSVLPLLLLIRIAQHVIGKRHYLREFVGALPLLLLMSLLWSWGEFVGLVTARPAAILTPSLQPLPQTLRD